MGEDNAECQQIVAAELLGRLLLQDSEPTDDATLRMSKSARALASASLTLSWVCNSSAVASRRDRMMSLHDTKHTKLRHGRKSNSRRFDGHKAAVVVDTDSQLITDTVDVLPGNPADNLGRWNWWSRC